jgi:hypothetical protein
MSNRKAKIIIPESNFEKFIIDLAQKHNIEYTHTMLDELADKFTELSGDDVITIPGGIDKLCIALKQENIITGKEMMALIHGYLRETDILNKVKNSQ